uniref:Uncharacterized protein n=1 Tax=Minutocellus polymorphus TaxID=265543 RepID=A0A7S0AYV9_9STRA|mmetsp:Transcript_6808/g.11354  ORF Transcript_6808/g.11354 Transcript_6808/m.11354 type:complete len:351 (+) Transcript_6808:41-1093(+)
MAETSALLSSEAIIAALLSTLLISLAPNIILFLSPNFGSHDGTAKRQNAALSIGQALAAGGLLGDVFLHTLPHAYADEAADHHHNDSDTAKRVSIGLLVLLGFTVFFCFDMLVRSVGGDAHHHHCHDHSMNQHVAEGDNSMAAEKGQKELPPATPSMRRIFNSTILLNLAADSLHNFTDGLAIGASFAASAAQHQAESVMTLLKSRGGVASLSVLLHELPHELGDFSILVSNGMSKRQAIMAQFSTAIAAFFGTIVGLLASAFDDTLGHEVLLPFVSGGFVYLAACSILPELLEERNVGVILRSGQVMAFGTGVGFMQLVAILEDMEGDHHQRYHGHGNHRHGQDDRSEL